MKSKLYFGLILLSLFFSVCGKTNAQTPDWLWVKSMGGIGGDEGNFIALDPAGSGDIYATGKYFGPSDFDPGEETFNLNGSGTFISKLDASGNFLWAKAMGGPEYFLVVNSIVIDPAGSGDVYSTGFFFGTADFDPNEGIFNLTSKDDGVDIFIYKLDRSGNFIWAKAMSGIGDDEGISIAIDPAGQRDIYFTGYFRGTGDFDPGAGIFNLASTGGVDIFISKFDDAGNFVWAKALGGTGDDDITSIAVDPAGSGHVYIAGYFRGTVDFDLGVDTFNLTSDGVSDIFISKLDSSGNFLWAKAMGGSMLEGVSSIAIDPSGSGDVYTAGYFRGIADFDPGTDTFILTSEGFQNVFISKLDGLGNFVWAKAIKTPFLVGIASMTIGPNGDVYTTGVFQGIVDFDPGAEIVYLFSPDSYDIFISKLDGSGNFLWAKAMGGTGYDNGSSIAVDALDHVHVVGTYDSPSISFDSTTLTNANSAGILSDIFIAKLDAFPVPVIVFQTNQINIYPNPANVELIIESDEDNFRYINITIYNIVGELVFSITDQNIPLSHTIDISDFATGIYFIEIDIDGNRVMKKMVKE